MAKAPKATTTDDVVEEDVGPVTETLTYYPGPQDPPSVKWGGHVFHAHVAKELTGNPNGTERERQNHHMIERAKENPHFGIGNSRPRRAKAADPKTAREYLAYFTEWLRSETFETAEELIVRFTKDRGLQQSCEVGTDDFTFIGGLFNPRLHELAKADGLSEPQVAALWASHGVNQLPW